MSNANNRGAYYERRSKLLLEKDGWLVEKANARIIWIKGRPISMHHDFFGLFDLLIVKGSIVKFIQVKYQGESEEGKSAGIAGLVALREKCRMFPAGIREIWIWKRTGNKVNLNIEEFKG